MANKLKSSSKYNVMTNQQAKLALGDQYKSNEVKTTKELVTVSVVIGVITLYFVEGMLIVLSKALLGFTSGNFLSNVVTSVAPSAANSSAVAASAEVVTKSSQVSVVDVLIFFTGFHSFFIGLISWTVALIAGFFVYYYLNSNNAVLKNKQQIKNSMLDPNDRYASDLPEMIQEYGQDIAMDAKAAVIPDVTAIMAHFLIKPDGIRGKDGNVSISKEFQKELWTTWQIEPNQLNFDGRKSNTVFDSKKLKFSSKDPQGNWVRDKSADVETVYDAINKSVFVKEEDLESEQPISGFYLVSTQPANTALVAATRAGKGQKYIEPQIDIWSRQVVQPNIIATDPKGELLRKNARALVLRGYDVKAINTLNPQLSASYNVYSYALQAADRGNFDETSGILTNLGDVMFAADGENAYWYNSASKLVNLCALAIIDYALEDARRIRGDEEISFEDRSTIVDDVFGSVSAVNVVHFLNQLYSTNLSAKENPELLKMAGYEGEDKSALFVFLELVCRLPMTPLRRALQADFAFLKAQTGNEKGMASVLSIALQIMAFFREEAITKVTSGNPSKTLDFIGLGFPRRFSVWFDDHFLTLNVLALAKTHWQAYRDPECKVPFGETKIKKGKEIFDTHKYETEGNIVKGWSHGVMEGMFDQPKAYMKLTILNRSGSIVDAFTFEFQKGYVKDSTGNTYERNIVTGDYDVQDGLLREYSVSYREDEDGTKTTVVEYTHRTFESHETDLISEKNKTIVLDKPIIRQGFAKYTERPSAIFLVTPPQQVTYNRIAIMVLDAAFNEQFSFAVSNPMTPKPFVATKYMLDEFGNISSNGKGIPNMDTKLSIGLGMLQQFTLVLQSFTQIDSLYTREKRDIMLGNIGNTIFLKSSSDDVIKYVASLGGTHKKLVRDGINEDLQLGTMKNIESMKTSSHMSASSRSVDESAIPENVFRSLGESANLGEAITHSGSTQSLVEGSYALPMAFQLLPKRPGGADDNINNSDIPVSAPNAEFDVSRNVPNYMERLQTLAEWVQVSQGLQTRWKERNDVQLDSEIEQKISSAEYNEIIMNSTFKGLRPSVAASDNSKLNDSAIESFRSGKSVLEEENRNIIMSDSELNKLTRESLKNDLISITQLEVGIGKMIKRNNPRADVNEIIGKHSDGNSFLDVSGLDVTRGAYIDPENEQILKEANHDATVANTKMYANGLISRIDLDNIGFGLLLSEDSSTMVSEAIAIGAKNSILELSKFDFFSADPLSDGQAEDIAEDEDINDFDFKLYDSRGNVMINGTHVSIDFIDFLCGFKGANPTQFPSERPSLNRDKSWVERGLIKFDEEVGNAFKEITGSATDESSDSDE